MIYVISDGTRRGLLKVGRATTLRKRLQDLQTGDADSHKLVAVVALDSRAEEVQLEAEFHCAFSGYKAKGGGREWYHDHPVIRSWLRALAVGNISIGLDD